MYWIRKNSSALRLERGFAQFLDEVMSIKNIVTKYKRATGGTDELLTDNKCLSNAFRFRLWRIVKLNAVAGSVAEQVLKARKIFRCGDQQNIPYAGQHQRRKRIVHHRFVVNRQQTLGENLSNGIEARARSARADNAFVIEFRCLGHVEFQSQRSVA